MVEAGKLLKQVIGKQAIVYKVLGVGSSDVQLAELCVIAEGKMTLNYRRSVDSRIFKSDLYRYKELQNKEVIKILEILKNMIVEVGD